MTEEKEQKAPSQKAPPKEKGASEEAANEIERIGNFISLYGIIMFSMAIVLDLVGLILLVLSFLGIGIPLSFIPDVIGLVFIGGLMLLSPSGGVVVSKGANKLSKKIAKKIGKKIGLSFLVELVPFVGDIAPSWTVAVYLHLKGS